MEHGRQRSAQRAAIIRTVMPAFGADGPGFAIHDPEVRRAYLETLTGLDQAQALCTKMGFTRIDGPCGSTGHGGCDRFYERAL